jgi:putative ABC transport system substrate-binding protein
LGYVEGQNVAIEYRFSQGQDDRLPALAGDLVSKVLCWSSARHRPGSGKSLFNTGGDPIDAFSCGSFSLLAGVASGSSRR